MSWGLLGLKRADRLLFRSWLLLDRTEPVMRGQCEVKGQLEPLLGLEPDEDQCNECAQQWSVLRRDGKKG